MPDINQILAQWMERHGGVQGAPFPVDPTVKSTDRNGDTVESPNPDPVYRYTFSDGSVLEMNGSGQIQKADEKPPKAPAGQTVNDPRTNQPIAVTTPSGGTVSLPQTPNNDRPGYQSYTDASGNLYESWTGHPWSQAVDASGHPIKGHVPGATDKQAPSDPSKWVPIKAPDGRVIALQDPVTGDRAAVPAEPTDRNSPAGSHKQTIENGRTITWAADGNGNWNIEKIGDQITDPNKPKEGDSRSNVSGGYEIREVYRGGQWVTDPTFTPKPYDPNLANKPKQGDTRAAVVDGYNVTQTYSGGDWVTTNVGTRATPQAPTTVSAPANQQYIVQETPGQAGVSTIENPNYVAQDVAGRVQQLQKLAQTKRDELNKAVQSGAKTKEEAATEFDAWWASNIEPQAQQLTQQQQQVQSEEQRKQEAEERSNLTTAQTAGRDAVAAAQAGLPYRVGPGFSTAVNQIANAFASGKPAGNLDIGSAVTFDMPDFQSIAQKATADALAHLSPTAAGISGRPMPSVPQGVDVRGALNKSNYAPTTTISPDGTVTITHSQSTPYQGAPNPNIFGSGMGAYVPPSLAPAAPPPALAPNEQRLFG